MNTIPSIELHESFTEPAQTNLDSQYGATTTPNQNTLNLPDQTESPDTLPKKAANEPVNPASATTAATTNPKISLQGPTLASVPPASIDILIKETHRQHETSQEIPDHESLDRSLSMIQANNNQGIPMINPEPDIPTNLELNNNNDQVIEVPETANPPPVEVDAFEAYQNAAIHRLSTSTLKQIAQFYVLMAFVYALSFFSLIGKIPYSVLLILLSVVCFLNIAKQFICIGPFNCNQRFYKLLDWISVSLVVSSSLVHITINKNLPLAPFVASGFISTLFFWKFARPTSLYIQKSSLIILRFLFWTQILLVALKVDGQIESWNLVFLMLFYLFVLIMSFSVGIFLIATIYICQIFPIQSFDHRVVGLIWDFLNTLLAWIWGFGTLGLINKLDGFPEDSLLNLYLIIGFGHIVVLTLYTAIFWRPIVKYLEYNLSLQRDQTGNRRYIFQTVKENISYLVRVSSTYFTRKDKGFKVQDKEQAQQWRQNIIHAKMEKRKKSGKWEYKETMDKNNDQEVEIKKSHKVPGYKNRTFCITKNPDNDCEKLFDDKDKANIAAKMSCYSQDDIDIVGNIKRPSLRNIEEYDEEEKENQCVVCFSAFANAVIMECGHGGICYDCAVEIWKRGENCVFCRNEIKEILKVSYIPGMDVAKVIEGTRKSIVFE